jgi:hypothetical protein
MERSLLLSAIDTALSLAASGNDSDSMRTYAEQASQEWLAYWPGDFRIRRLLANALAAEDKISDALKHMRQAAEADAENTEAYSGLIDLLRRNNLPDLAAEADACRFALDPTFALSSTPPEWSDRMQSAMGMSRAGRWQEARWAAESVLRGNASFPLPGVVHIKAMLQLAEYSTALVAAGDYRKRWPSCVAFPLLAAQACFSLGRSTEGVEFLHACTVMDPASEICDRYLGSLNPYKPLWPARLEAALTVAIPQAVVIAAGWNRLGSAGETPREQSATLSPDTPALLYPNFDSKNPSAFPTPIVPPSPIPGEKYKGPSAGEAPAAKRGRARVTLKQSTVAEVNTPPEPLLESDAGLEDLRARLLSISKRLPVRKLFGSKGGGRPAYVVLTSTAKLSAWFSGSEFASVEKGLQEVVTAKRTGNWSAYLMDVDNASSLEPFGLAAADAGNAWQVKQLLSGLESVLQKRGEMIGAVLIVGGHEIIPFHLLPNPATDDDADVPSDNPYATRDENYLVPEWPVGRLPTPRQAGAAFLCGLLARAAAKPSAHQKNFLGDLSVWLRTVFRPMLLRPQNISGYSAEIWKRASAEVLRDLGPASALMSSPPMTSANVSMQNLRLPAYGYFNLHGMPNSPVWLGQRASASASGGEEYPIALTPAQIVKNGKTPKAIFSEACYGSLILGKEPENAISLKFLDAGVGAMVGSTRIGYGAATAPLIAADLLARHFLVNCKSGMASGEALRRAKISFADEMNKRQGYLDPEDQKSLISFVLYGDPLYVPEAQNAKAVSQKSFHSPRRPDDIPLVQTLESKIGAGEPSATVQRNLKKELHRYLPGMESSAMKYFRPQLADKGNADLPGQRKGKQASTPRTPAWVIAMENTYTIDGQLMTSFVRMSVDARGKVMKLAVSR